MTIYVGSTETISRTFYDETGVLTADPSVLTFSFTTPEGVTTVYTYGTDVQLEKDSTGVYHVDLDVDESGQWAYEWSASGDVVDVYDGGFVAVDPPVPVTIRFQTSTPTPIEGIKVSVLRADGGIVAAGTTDASGTFTVHLVPLIEYRLEASKDKVVFSTDMTLSPLDSPSQPTFDFTAMVLAIDDPTPPRMVTLFGYAYEGGNALPTKVIVDVTRGTFVTSDAPATGVDPNNLQVTGSRQELESRPLTGFWSCLVPAGARVRVTVPSARFQKVFAVPDDPALTALNVVDARPDPGDGNEIGFTLDAPVHAGTKGVG